MLAKLEFHEWTRSLYFLNMLYTLENGVWFLPASHITYMGSSKSLQ